MSKRLFIILIPLILFASLQANAQLSGVQSYVEFEKYENTPMGPEEDIPNFEVPIDSRIKFNFAERFDPRIRNALVFEKNGQKYIRFVVHPKDDFYSNLIKAYLNQRGLDSSLHYYFKGYRTYSRSIVLRDPLTNVRFSIKMPTNKAPGPWPRGKYLDEEQSNEIRLMADYLFEVNKKTPFEHVVIMDEPASISIVDQEESKRLACLPPETCWQPIDFSNVVRELGPILVEGGNTYIPFTAIISNGIENFGARIARINGSEDPYAFWTEHGIKVAAIGVAELLMKSGLSHDSPHSQNFLIELDSNLKPTGRLVIRDLGDMYVYKPLAEILNRATGLNLLEHLKDHSNVREYASILFNVNKADHSTPSWFHYKEEKWYELFLEYFEKEISRITGVTIDQSLRNYEEEYDISTKSIARYLLVTQSGFEQYLEKQSHSCFSLFDIVKK